MEISQALPTGTTLTDQFARELAHLLGPAYQPADDTLFAADLRTLGEAMADGYDEGTLSLDQAFVTRATVLLEEWERRLGLVPNTGLTDAERQAVLTAKRRATGGGTKARVRAALETLAGTATVRANRALDVTAEPRKVFLMAVVVSAAVWGDARKLRAIRAVLGQMLPGHAKVNVTTRVGFRCDDPLSLLDRDLLGS